MLQFRGRSNQDQVIGEESSGTHRRCDTPPTVPTTDSENESEPLFPNPGQYFDKFVDIDPETKTLKLKHYLLLCGTRRIHIPDILSSMYHAGT